MKKVLIFSYYWPPSGGAGVQRWLKLSWYLQESGIQVYVIAPKPKAASYFIIDESLEKEIHPGIKVIRTRSFEPINWYKSLVGSAKVPTAGFSNINPNSIFQKLSLKLRSNLFIPDPRKYWGWYAGRAAAKLIKKEGVSHIISTSPPHSVQLIGLNLKKKFNLKWVADLRDLWTDVYYYGLLQHSLRSSRKDALLEQKVLQNADHITTVSPGFISNFHLKRPELSQHKFSFIPNGFDPRDFKSFNYAFKPGFVLTYTGTINLQYNIDPFIEGLKIFLHDHPESGLKIRFVGFTDKQLIRHIHDAGLSDYFEFMGYVSHTEAIRQLSESYALLLFGPLNSKNEEGGIPAKVFEYLASGRKIIYTGKKDGFIADILRSAGGGKAFENESAELAGYLEDLYSTFRSGNFSFHFPEEVNIYSRENQAQTFVRLLNEL